MLVNEIPVIYPKNSIPLMDHGEVSEAPVQGVIETSTLQISLRCCKWPLEFEILEKKNFNHSLSDTPGSE